jgi:tRNA(Ile)-lysidine synthase
MKRNAKIAFEQSVLRTFRSLDKRPRKILLGCSGGVDSMVLLQALFHLKNSLKLEIIVAHVHHGRGNTKFRTQAWRCVRDFSQKLGLEFISNSPNGRASSTVRLKSEASLRDFRWAQLQLWRTEKKADAIVVAHHYQDLLETRLMRLIRGTGPAGLKGMEIFERERKILRPLLMLEKAQILEYAKKQKVPFVDDPTNEKQDAFRNWIRGWLRKLDQRHPNGTRNLARSFMELVQSSQNETAPDMTESGIDRRMFLETAPRAQKTRLAHYCRQMRLRNYTQGHIEELMKRLDVSEKHFTFELLQCVWSVTPERIKASRLTGRV